MGNGFAQYASLTPGTPADLVLFDPDAGWTVDVNKFASMGRNTPLDGVTLRGRVGATVVGGRIVFEEPTVLNKGDVA